MTNRLRLKTEETGEDGVFLVRWSVGLETIGALRVRVAKGIEDGRIVAELVGARHLLVEKNVCGHDKCGAGLEITFSNGQVKKLGREMSSKVHLILYAHFLWTRFLGATIDVDTFARQWIDLPMTEGIEDLEVSEPTPERLPVRGVGEVAITPYFVRRYVERFNRKPSRAWREIRELLAQPALRPVQIKRRTAIADLKHRTAGRFYFIPTIPKRTKQDKSIPRHDMVIVLAPIGRRKWPETTTLYAAGDALLKRLTPVPAEESNTSRFGQVIGRAA